MESKDLLLFVITHAAIHSRVRSLAKDCFLVAEIDVCSKQTNNQQETRRSLKENVMLYFCPGEQMRMISVMTQANSEEEISIASVRSRT